MMRCNPRVPKCSWGTVSEVMRAINGRSKKCPRPRWIACFTANVRVFAFMRHLLETEEDNCNREVAAPSLTRLANSSGRDTEVFSIPLAKPQSDGSFQWVRGRLLIFCHHVALVSPPDCALTRVCLEGNKLMGWLLRVRARILSEVAYISTLGGGYASVRNIPKAIEYAVKLFHCACLLHDDEMKSKSRLFVGWSMLWVGNKTYARKIFKAEIEDSIRRDHEVGWLRGLGAMHQLENPVYGDHGEVLPDPALQWGRVFSNAIAEEIRDAAEHGGFEMSSLYRKAESET
ncbi:hypothetical protein DIPPA_20028 [Diplonema papillatum]|nr:hypothetical protein DIPPA_20028 [Diplonema papillatum]